MKFGSHNLKRQILLFCDPHIAATQEICSVVQIYFVKKYSHAFQRLFNMDYHMHFGYVTSSVAPLLLQFIALCETSKRHAEISFPL